MRLSLVCLTCLTLFRRKKNLNAYLSSKIRKLCFSANSVSLVPKSGVKSSKISTCVLTAQTNGPIFSTSCKRHVICKVIVNYIIVKAILKKHHMGKISQLTTAINYSWPFNNLGLHVYTDKYPDKFWGDCINLKKKILTVSLDIFFKK